jgi:hypothetical protein
MEEDYGPEDSNSYRGDFQGAAGAPRLKELRDTGSFPSPYESAPPESPFTFDRLQIAGILLIIVFIWGAISAVAIAMFEIDILALTEFEDDGKGDIYGWITDDEGNVLVNTTVAIHGTQHFAKSNLDGFYSMENIKEGDYEIEASKQGYGSVTKRISLDAHIPEEIDFVLSEGGTDETINEQYGSNLSELRFLNYSTAIFIILYGALALIGGIFAYFQRYYWIAMTGGISGVVSGVLTIGIIIAPILSVIALILIINNKENFLTSESPIVTRIFGVRGAPARPSRAARPGPKRMRAPGPPPKAKAAKPKTYADEFAAYKPVGPVEEEEEPAEEPEIICAACRGAVRSESQGIICQCGEWYHRFCASSIPDCKNCGSPL